MEYIELIEQIFQICIIPLLGILTSYLVAVLKKKKSEIEVKVDNETLKKYLDLLDDTVVRCIETTNQTYVNSLKEQGSFDAEAQKKAFTQTYESVINILGQDAISYLNNIFGDLNQYISNKIESEIVNSKKEEK